MFESSQNGSEMLAEQKFQKNREAWCKRYISQNSLDEKASKSWVDAARAFEKLPSLTPSYQEPKSDFVEYSGPSNGSKKMQFSIAYINSHQLDASDKRNWSRAFRLYDDLVIRGVGSLLDDGVTLRRM